MHDTQQSESQFQSLVSLTLQGGVLTYADWMMLGCAARDLGISFEAASQIVLASQQSSATASMPLHSGPMASSRDRVQPVASATPRPEVVPSRRDAESAQELRPEPPLEVEPESLDPVVGAAERRTPPRSAPPSAGESMTSVGAGVFVPTSYVAVARDVRRKYEDFMRIRLPVLASSAARAASLKIEMFKVDVDTPPVPGVQLASEAPRAAYSQNLASWWNSLVTDQTRRELERLGGGSLLIQCEGMCHRILLTRSGWTTVTDGRMVAEGNLKDALAFDWFRFRPEWVTMGTEGGWTTKHVVQLKSAPEEPWFIKSVIQLEQASRFSSASRFIVSLASGIRAESASFAQARRGIRALVTRLHGADAATELSPSDGSLPEIQRAASAALTALSGVLSMADDAAC